MFNVAKILPSHKSITDIELVPTNLTGMMEYIIDTIELTNDLMANTLTCYEDNLIIYQLCFIDDPKTPHKELNQLSTELVYEKTEIYGPAVLMCSLISDNLTCTPYTTNIESIKNLYEFRTNHKALLIDDQTITQINFKNNPLENIENASEYAWFEHNILSFNLIIYMKKQSSPAINKKITKLLGTYKVSGPIIIALKKYAHDYEDMNEMLFNKLMKLCSGPMKKRVLTVEEKKDPEEIDGLYTINNSYVILERRLLGYEEKCHNCEGGFDGTKLICTGCFRMEYCSKICREKDWPEHKKECLFKVAVTEYVGGKEEVN